ncbi:hypothetical protein ABFX02_09G008500 [Erythranthe guttata]
MAYAAVEFLKHTIECLVSPSQLKLLLPNSEMKLFYDELCHLKSFLETTDPSQSIETIESTEAQILDAVYKIGDPIVSFISDHRFLPASESSVNETLTLLLKFRQEICPFTKTLTEDDHNVREESHSSASAIVPLEKDRQRIKLFVSSKTMQRLYDKLRDWVCSGASNFKVIFVVGMAGIGKTTLVKQVYDNPYTIEHFDLRLFLPIGPQCDLKEILLLALDQLGVHSDENQKKNYDENSLREYVYQSLHGRRYLIVLDDIWNTEVWNDLRRFFLDNSNQSRIILTTRLLDFADRAGIHTSIQIPFLNEDESWNLLREKVFTDEEICSRELEKIGRKIAKKCEGLPLAIIQVAELLCEIEKTVESWKTIAEKEDPLTIRSDDDTPLSKAIFPSYRMLPQYLKVCFLYMGVFPKKYVITRPKLIRLWVCEGFLEPQENKTSEEKADEYLNELISQSVVLNTKLRSVGTGTTKTCRLHFTFRSLCVNEAKSEKIFLVIKKYTDSFPEEIDSQHRLCFHNNVLLSFQQVLTSLKSSVPDIVSLLCYGPKQQYPIRLYLPFRLLKILDAASVRFYEFPNQVVELVHLRYLAVTSNGEIPSSISCLWNLEVLIIHRHHRVIKPSNSPVYLPLEIWKLHKLKHLECTGFDLPDPFPVNDGSLILEKLLTLSGVSAHSCTKRVLARTPNLIKLGILIESAHDSVETFSFFGNFASLHQFESFKCVVVNPGPKVVSCIPINFPANIKKITLSGCAFPWEYMRVIAALPNLAALKLRWYAFCGPEWDMSGWGGFPQLKYLLMEDLDIQHWIIDDSFQFPSLTRLIIRHCYRLREIPSEIGEIPTLEVIQVDDSSQSVVISGRQIRDEQSDFGNDYLQLYNHSSLDGKKKKKHNHDQLLR